MGSISFQVVGDASVGTRTKTYQVADADINRLVAWAQVAFRSPEQPPLTVPQALLGWADLMMSQTKARVVAHERQTAQINFEAT